MGGRAHSQVEKYKSRRTVKISLINQLILGKNDSGRGSKQPTVHTDEAMTTEKGEFEASWMDLIIDYKNSGRLLEDPRDARKIKKGAQRYVFR